MSGNHAHHEERSAEEIRAYAVKQLLLEKNVVTEEEIEKYLHLVEDELGFMLGARVVAHAWCDQSYKARLLEDGSAAIEELGIETGGTKIVVVENTDDVHNIVCCTLCSCYPWRVLGLPPTWYKSAEYRSRIVIEPRAVLGDFGTCVPEDAEIRVWDSTSECRYLVLPRRPKNTDSLSERELAELVSRDAMIGVSLIPDAMPASI